MPRSAAAAESPGRDNDRRFCLAIAGSVLFHCAWLGGGPALNGRDPPAATLQVRLARPSAQPPAAVAAGNPPLAAAAPSAPPHSRSAPPQAPAFPSPPAAAPAASSGIAAVDAAPAAAAPHAAPAAVEGVLLNEYGRHLARTIARQQRYPRLAQVRQWQGTAVLQLQLAADGSLAEVRVLSSSGHEILDRQAIDMVREAVPLPHLPDAFAGRPLTIDVPVVFRLAG